MHYKVYPGFSTAYEVSTERDMKHSMIHCDCLKPGSQYDAGASVKSAEHNQRRIVNQFYVGTLGALVRATATQGIDSISIRALASVAFR